MTSPSFTIGRSYDGRVPVSHLDLFRLETLEGEDPALLDDYLDARGGRVRRVAGGRSARAGARAGGAARAPVAPGRRPARLAVDGPAGSGGARSERHSRPVTPGRLRHLDGDDERLRAARRRRGVLARPPPSPERLLGPAGHSQELLPELERLLGESGTSWDEVESIAVGRRPGHLHRACGSASRPRVRSRRRCGVGAAAGLVAGGARRGRRASSGSAAGAPVLSADRRPPRAGVRGALRARPDRSRVRLEARVGTRVSWIPNAACPRRASSTPSPFAPEIGR